MAVIYVRSTDGNDADSGATWALAKATLAGASAIAVAGDTVWVSHNHAESTAAPVSVSWPGTVAAPIRVLCGNDAAEPPTALAATGSIETTGNNAIELSGTGTNYIYMYGLTYRCGVGTASSPVLELNQGNGGKLFENCTFESAGTGGGGDIALCVFNGWGETICKNCDFKLGNVSQTISVSESPAWIVGGALLAGSTPNGLFALGNSSTIFAEGFDMSSVGATMNLGGVNSQTGGKLHARNCRLPASWSGSVNSDVLESDSVFELINTASSGSEYRYQRKTQFGIIDNEATIVRTGGANDGIKSISWKMVSNADPEWNHQLLRTAEIVRWNETTGSAITVTVEILHDSVTNMTNQQIWLDVQYLGTSGFPLSSFINDSSGDYLSTAADQTTSSVAWTTTGMSNPNKQKLSVTFTPQEKGFLYAVVHMAMASKTVYVDPKLEIS